MITASDLPWRLSVTAGSAGNSMPSTPAGSLGKYISTTAWDQVTLQNNLFDNVSGDENLALDQEYRCVFVYNAHPTLTLYTPAIHLDSQTAGGADITIGLDPTANSQLGSSSAQAVAIAGEDSAPAGVTFTAAATSRATGLFFPDLAPGYCRAVWLKRAATNSPPLNPDQFVVALTGDTE